MNNVLTFNFHSHQVRVVDLYGSAWFVAADVCSTLRYGIRRKNGTTDARLIRSILSDDETLTTRVSKMGPPSLVISESGLFKVAVKADKARAQAFLNWVGDTIFPVVGNTTNETKENSMNTEIALAVSNGRPVTTSRDIADKFGKQHKNVLRDIEALECSGEFRGLNFELTEETKKIGATTRKTHYYEMTRDGFTFLAMGFTGKKAAQWKEKYIQAFNAMEQELLNQTKPAFVLPDFTNPAIAARAWADAIEGQQKAEAEVKMLSVENKAMSDELNFVSVDEFRSLKHVYLTHAQKVKLGQMASRRCRELGIEVAKQARVIRTKTGEEREVYVNVYPRGVLEEVFKTLH